MSISGTSTKFLRFRRMGLFLGSGIVGFGLSSSWNNYTLNAHTKNYENDSTTTNLAALVGIDPKSGFKLPEFNSIGIIRFGRAALTAASIVVDYKLSIYYKKLPEDPEEVDKIWSQVHRRSAVKLLELCKENRGIFIKVGQHMGALDYLLPSEYTETLRILHNQAPTSPIEDVFRVLKEDLRIDMTCQDVFVEFDPEPLGAASLAQVYKAKLRDGRVVAVKVQHPNVRAHSYVDMKTIEILANIAAWSFPDFKLLWLVDETKKNLPKELDFLQEAHNAELIEGLMEKYSWLKIPRMHWNLSSKRVLTMEYYDGGKVTDLDYMKKEGIPPVEVVSKLGQLYAEMIFINGNVHCDPHPGNVLVRKNSSGKLEVCLLDHGLYTYLSDEFRYNYSNLWLNILNANVDGIKLFSKALGVEDLYVLFASMVTARSWESISSPGGITQKKLTRVESAQIKQKIGGFLSKISEILDRVPRPMVLIFKTNDLLRGVEHALNIEQTMTSFLTMTKYCIRAVYSEESRRCLNKYCQLKVSFLLHWSLFKIEVYELYLWLRHIARL